MRASFPKGTSFASAHTSRGAGGAFVRAQDCLSDCAAPMRLAEDHPSLLDSTEAAFLEMLLSGSSLREFERAHACMASVLVDSINDKLYDEFADICIDTCTGEPAIIEDYVPELRDLLDLS